MSGGKRVHRLVVFPEWQGLGLGSRILNETGQYSYDNGMEVYIKTSHPAMGKFLESIPLWKPTTHNLKSRSTSFIWKATETTCWCYKRTGQRNHTKTKPTTMSPVARQNYRILRSETRTGYKYSLRREPVKYFSTCEEAEQEMRYQSAKKGCQQYEVMDGFVLLHCSGGVRVKLGVERMGEVMGFRLFGINASFVIVMADAFIWRGV
jgi:GNAT superfamily N-acetyltransferase